MISRRLSAIAGFIEKDKVVFDVGSDHGLLPCFLVQNGICQKAYAGDIAIGPLDNAKENIDRFKLEGKVIPVFSDGLKLAPKDVDVVVISGMGYYTIEHILNETCDVSMYKYFVVQSNTDVDLLRKYISDHGYTIEDELVVEDGFYYEIVRFSADLHDPYDDLEIKYGPILLKRRDETFLSYLRDRRDKLVKINEKANSDEYRAIIKEIDNILNG